MESETEDRACSHPTYYEETKRRVAVVNMPDPVNHWDATCADCGAAVKWMDFSRVKPVGITPVVGARGEPVRDRIVKDWECGHGAMTPWGMGTQHRQMVRETEGRDPWGEPITVQEWTGECGRCGEEFRWTEEN